MTAKWVWFVIGLVVVVAGVLVATILPSTQSDQRSWRPAPTTVSLPSFGLADQYGRLPVLQYFEPTQPSIAASNVFSRTIPLPSEFVNILAVVLSPNGQYMAVACRNSLNNSEPSANGGRNVRIDVYTSIEGQTDFNFTVSTSVRLDVILLQTVQIMFLNDSTLVYAHRNNTETLLYRAPVQQLNDSPIWNSGSTVPLVLLDVGATDRLALEEQFATDRYRYRWVFETSVATTFFYSTATAGQFEKPRIVQRDRLLVMSSNARLYTPADHDTDGTGTWVLRINVAVHSSVPFEPACLVDHNRLILSYDLSRGNYVSIHRIGTENWSSTYMGLSVLPLPLSNQFTSSLTGMEHGGRSHMTNMSFNTAGSVRFSILSSCKLVNTTTVEFIFVTDLTAELGLESSQLPMLYRNQLRNMSGQMTRLITRYGTSGSFRLVVLPTS
jgi:hypothetical protein